MEIIIISYMKTLKIKDKKINIKLGDITEEKVDAIVNAANSNLKHGGGVAGAIVRGGGRIIQEQSDKIGYVPVGKAVITGAGKLACKYVIHTVGPVWGEGEEEKKLKSAVLSALKLATERGLRNISIPAISTGIFGFPKEKGTKIILTTVHDFLERQKTTLSEINLVNIDEETYEFYIKAYEELKKGEKL